MIRRCAAVLLDAALFATLFYLAAIVALLLAGTLEIAFGWNILLTRAGGTAVWLLALAAAAALHFVLPRRRYGTTPGRSLLAPRPRPAFRWYLAAAAAMLAAYLAVWAVSTAAFSSLVAGQRRRLASLGLPREWRDIAPAYSRDNNAAQFFYDTTMAFTGLQGVHRTFAAAVDHPESLAAAGAAVRAIMAEDAAALAWFERGLACSTLVAADYRAAAPDTLYRAAIPSYLRVQQVAKLYALRAALAAGQGDWAGAGELFGRTARLSRLLAPDPLLIGKMVALALQRTAYDGMALAVRAGWRDPRCYQAIAGACAAMPPVAGLARDGLNAESVVTGALVERLTGGFLPRELAELAGGGPGAKAAAAAAFPLYQVWKRWNQYCWLRMDEYGLLASDPANSPDRAESLRAESERFRERRNRIPALFAAIAGPNVASMYHRELECRALPGAVMLFAAAADHRRRTGRPPASLAELVPAYFPSPPASPIDGGGYRLENDGKTLSVYAPARDGRKVPPSAAIDFR